MKRQPVTLEFSPRWNDWGKIVQWVGQVTGNPPEIFDKVHGCEVRTAWGVRCEIVPTHYGFCVITEGLNKGGRRYRRCWDFSQAVETAEKWAGRRFAYVEGGE